MEHFYCEEPCDKECRETSILYDAKDKMAHIYTFDKRIIKKLLTHEEDIERIIHYPNNVDEYVASIEKKRVRVSAWKDPSIKNNRGFNLKKGDDDEIEDCDEDDDETDEIDDGEE